MPGKRDNWNDSTIPSSTSPGTMRLPMRSGWPRRPGSPG